MKLYRYDSPHAAQKNPAFFATRHQLGVKYRLSIVLFSLLWLLLGCQSLLTPPRVATEAAQTAVPSPTAQPPLLIEAPTPTPGGNLSAPAATLAAANDAPSLTIWVNETSPAHEAALNSMIDAFVASYPANVELRMVDPALLPKLVETAVISSAYDLPDIIIHPIAYTVGWAERGILDTEAAATAVAAIGPDTFNPDALNLVQVNGQTAALPSDGYLELLIYRQDWFSERNLDTPNTFTAMFTAAETLFDSENLIAGFVAPTESNLVSTQQVFEYLAVANNCQLINDEGRVLLREPACQEALDFYYEIIHNYSPTGVQTDTSTRNAYLFGRGAMIISPPHILPQLAGLDANVRPTCAECATNSAYLAQNSGILTQINGTDYGHLTYLGITNKADRETAVAFAKFWFNEGYETWLQVETERKVPLRLGTTDDPRRFIDAWGTTPIANSSQSLQDIYGTELITQLRNGIATSNRWGLPQGQGALITDLYENLTFSIVLQEMLSGYFNTEKTLQEAYIRVIDFLPNYPYDQESDTPDNP
ncbi:MAG: extracellular solute-binding protein [Chloroflexota bacterium]|nr:extracellular solute-binding protein [Ardenticatenaceae bacterium]